MVFGLHSLVLKEFTYTLRPCRLQPTLKSSVRACVSLYYVRLSAIELKTEMEMKVETALKTKMAIELKTEMEMKVETALKTKMAIKLKREMR